LISSGVLFAQMPVKLAFEAASVRANHSSDPAASRFPLGPGDAYAPGRLFLSTNQPLIAYLRFAYKLGQGGLLDLPGWVYTDGFDIEARASGNPSKDDMRLMMRALLADRFKLRTHTGRKRQSVFRLVRADARKAARQLQPDAACAAPPHLDLPEIACGSLGPLSASAPGQARLGGRGVTVAQIAGILKNPYTGLDRTVVDRTGLAGTFDFLLEWSLAPDGSPAFTEALRQQLGLKLAPETEAVEMLVVDRVERPSEN
jgi:uncharacterized protein (TIGR03435 family)